MTNTLTGNFLNARESEDFGDFSAHDLVRHLPDIFETAGDLQAIVRLTTRNAGRTSLLVFEAKDGWEPLCAHLGVPVPSEPFPHVNDREEFQTHAQKGRELSGR